MSDKSIIRITRELWEIKKNADLCMHLSTRKQFITSRGFTAKRSVFTNDLDIAIAVDYDEDDMRNVRAIILGPPETPYQFGLFEFSIKFGREYPGNPPSVKAVTTNSGACRFLGKTTLCLVEVTPANNVRTWTGQAGEQWSSAQGLESVLISIQSLMSANPYENEPGYEHAKSKTDEENMAHYKAKICHETIRIAVLQPLEAALGIVAGGTSEPLKNGRCIEPDYSSEDEGCINNNPFIDLRKRRFLWYYDSYVQLIDRESQKEAVAPKKPFQKMPFESSGNSMDGHFDYPELHRRLTHLKAKILEETKNWATRGLEAIKNELGIAANLQRQYEQIVETLKSHKNYSIDLSLADNNPFVWKLTYFGRPTTPLEGGIIKIRIHLSTKFPEEQPRVFVETRLSHIRVSKDGVLCYFPNRLEEMRQHVEAIVAALEEADPPYDPRTTVNIEASKLFWGSPEDRRVYKRTLRRDIERSVE
ncbi:ubiquitin-conjugating enzyme E2 [Aspergillus mulundensis]|uniref:UBC core domain-containing protein n=1 Tax=Aspergillus mulundensis TaxID=1810919 RepID=A0A3D8RKI5_9EURO|nr:Uncharacterized protein DSM5745_07217 [Aspergillus mulundensis]RDW74555.1 Uncharacterized protein DSM5745_07217 [Aspergillus mulundensis]